MYSHSSRRPKVWGNQTTGFPQPLIGIEDMGPPLSGLLSKVTSCFVDRYAVKRASQLDVAGVVRCRDLLEQFNGKLLEFEFRNGNLR